MLKLGRALKSFCAQTNALTRDYVQGQKTLHCDMWHESPICTDACHASPGVVTIGLSLFRMRKLLHRWELSQIGPFMQSAVLQTRRSHPVYPYESTTRHCFKNQDSICTFIPWQNKGSHPPFAEARLKQIFAHL